MPSRSEVTNVKRSCCQAFVVNLFEHRQTHFLSTLMIWRQTCPLSVVIVSHIVLHANRQSLQTYAVVYERKNLTKKTRYKPIEFIPLPFINNERFRPQGSGTNVQWALFFICSSSVIMCTSNNKFFTKPHASPSVVSAGHSIPHWLGRNKRGPLTFWVFSNWLLTWVIIPKQGGYI
jgi:hypothetical protein